MFIIFVVLNNNTGILTVIVKNIVFYTKTPKFPFYHITMNINKEEQNNITKDPYRAYGIIIIYYVIVYI